MDIEKHLAVAGLGLDGDGALQGAHSEASVTRPGRTVVILGRGASVLGIVVEEQLGRDDEKRWV